MSAKSAENAGTVKGYPFDGPQQKKELVLKTYEYDMPFNYSNITVYRKDYDGGEFHGVELVTNNQPFPLAKLPCAVPDQWTKMQTVFTVPPGAAECEYRLDVANMARNESLQIADAFAAVVPESWSEHDDIPPGVPNLLENPTFAGPEIPPKGWKLDQDSTQTGQITMFSSPDSKDRSGLSLCGVQISLQSILQTVVSGQRIAFSLWIKSSCRTAGTVWLFPRFRSAQGFYLSQSVPDCIVITEEHPIVRVAVIGSACTPPGYIMLEAEPCPDFYRRGDFVRAVAPVRFRQGGLWGMHLRADQWVSESGGDFGYEPIPEGMIRRYPGMRACSVKAHYSAFPMAGMSCAVFEIPRSQKVTITGGSENNLWISDGGGVDDHYSFRTIRTTVAVE